IAELGGSCRLGPGDSPRNPHELEYGRTQPPLEQRNSGTAAVARANSKAQARKNLREEADSRVFNRFSTWDRIAEHDASVGRHPPRSLGNPVADRRGRQGRFPTKIPPAPKL